MTLFRRLRAGRERIRQLEAETAAQRAIIADLGRQLDAAQQGPLGDNPLTTLPFPPKEWTT